MGLLWLLAVTALVLALVVLAYALASFGKRRLTGGLLRLTVALVLLVVAALAGVLALGSVGYRALFREQLAATVETEVLAPQRYRARVSLPSGETHGFELAGDQLYLDARFIKWHPWLTVLGVEPAYRLERVAGRYLTLDDEQTAPRTVYAISDAPPIDLFALSERFPALSRLIDAEYGTATFTEVEDGARYAVTVSNTGLLIRKLE